MPVNSLTPPFTLQRTIGSTGTGSTVGAVAQASTARWTTPAPWSNSSILVPDNTLGRVTEVNVTTGLLIKVWFTGLPAVSGVAATTTRIVVTYGTDTASTYMKMYDLAGALQWSVGGAALADTITTNVGVLLGGPYGVEFSQDGAYVLLAEAYSQRITKWNAATGAYMGLVGSGFRSPYDVTQCYTGTGEGSVTPDYFNNRIAVVSEAGVVTTYTPSVTGPTAVALLPGKGVLVASQAASSVVFLSSVTILTHPSSGTAVTPSSVDFSVALTAISASTSLTYAWTNAGAPVGTNAPTYTYSSSNSDADNGPTYAIVCTITHALGTAVSNVATLTVTRGVTIAPTSTLATAGGANVQFTATQAAGNTASAWAWTLNGAAVGTSAAIYNFAPQDSHGGSTVTVLCTVTALKGTTVSNSATVTVQVRVCRRGSVCFSCP
jgi:hypothetical protein